MKFERETNLYQDQALARKFKSQDTEFEIIQGHINAMISESEIRELINGGKTMYSAMNDIDVDVKGLTANLSELHSTVDENSGQITELDSKQATYEATLEQFSGSLSQVSEDLSGVTGRVTTVEGTAEGLRTSVSEFNTKIANKIDTYFYGYAPTLSNIPASGWNTTELKEAHKDAIFYDTSTGYCYRFTKSGQSFSWVRVKDSDIASAMQAASDAQDTADGKVVTYAQNDPPTGNLVEGDLWIDTNDRNKLYRWNGVKWNAYSDSSSLNAWLTTTYETDKDALLAQIDGKVETYYQADESDPSTDWKTADAKSKHRGDLWYKSTSGKYVRWSGTEWVEITATPPRDVVTAIDGKARIFTVEPITPYSKGDLWVQGELGDIMRCISSKATGDYSASDWEVASKYTDDTTFNNWNNTSYTSFKSFVDQLPGTIRLTVTGSEQIEPSSIFSGAYHGDYVPTGANSPASGWTTDAIREKHVGDIYCKSTGEVYQYVNGKDGVVIRFSEKCASESSYDYVVIYYADGSGYKKTPNYSGTSLSGLQVFIPSLTFWLYWHTDTSKNAYYGFSIDEITHEFSDVTPPSLTASALPDYTETVVSGSTYPESSHDPYENSANILWKYTASGMLGTSNYGWTRRADPSIRQTQASIEILDDQIQSKVDVNGVISSINQSSEAVTINANRISLNGDTTIDAINGATGTATINANKININGVITAGSLAKKNEVLGSAQRIYRKVASGASAPTAYTTWVTSTSDVSNAWTTRRPSYSSSYPVLYTAIQAKNADGTVTCTTPIIDDTLTVIDGGHITTGEIDANQVRVKNIDASEINTGYLSASRIKGDTLKLGGSGNVNGLAKVYDAKGNLTGRWNNSGLYIGTVETSSKRFYVDTAGAVYGYSLALTGYCKIDTTEHSSIKQNMYYNGSKYAYIELEDTGMRGKMIDSNNTFFISPTGTSYSRRFQLGFNTSDCVAGFYDKGFEVYTGTKRCSLDVSNGTFRLRGQSTSYPAINATFDGGSNYVEVNELIVHSTKSRLADTRDYSKRLLYCYETPTPMFGDVGDAIVADDGLCYIQIDPTFAETISTNQYQIFLQAYGEGECHVKERHNTYFVVKGAPGLEFGWEIKAKQLGYTQLRLDRKPESEEVSIKNSIDYIMDAQSHISEINKGRITA